MKSRAAFEFTVGKMVRNGEKLYFWTFTFRDVHSLTKATALWNQLLTVLKRKIKFQGVRVLELHEEHGCHFHVLTNRRYAIRQVLQYAKRYGFGRTHIEEATDVIKAVRYLCKYLSKPRPKCLKRARLWAGFGDIERTRVVDIVTDSPFSRIIRRRMGLPSPLELLEGATRDKTKRGRLKFADAIGLAIDDYMQSFDSDYRMRQLMWQGRRAAGECTTSHLWDGREMGEGD